METQKQVEEWRRRNAKAREVTESLEEHDEGFTPSGRVSQWLNKLRVHRSLTIESRTNGTAVPTPAPIPQAPAPVPEPEPEPVPEPVVECTPEPAPVRRAENKLKERKAEVAKRQTRTAKAKERERKAKIEERAPIAESLPEFRPLPLAVLRALATTDSPMDYFSLAAAVYGVNVNDISAEVDVATGIGDGQSIRHVRNAVRPLLRWGLIERGEDVATGNMGVSILDKGRSYLRDLDRQS
jgi:hypothetical protein